MLCKLITSGILKVFTLFAIYLLPSFAFVQDSLAVKNLRTQAYHDQHTNNNLPSKSHGTVSDGALENGKLVPFYGNNFEYFDTASYFAGRAFVHHKVLETILNSYKEFESLVPYRKFFIMECSNKNGGKMYPHHTHQNGLSIDFMTPLLKDGEPYTGLDTLGADHYWLEFDDSGKLLNDSSVSIDFNLVAHHILILEKTARKYGLKIAKVIFKLELKDELFMTEYGKKLAETSVYFAKNLPELINSLHDDHYHVDFEILK